MNQNRFLALFEPLTNIEKLFWVGYMLTVVDKFSPPPGISQRFLGQVPFGGAVTRMSFLDGQIPEGGD